ncbi:inverse autotransporter beta domain-containing protein [Xenorhabdus kozodoii]|uniref:Putative invasin n=1 Tax=Xenorhabdus kozodoii TaxID=351676 RepID=A0A2D0LGS9_9GAMM|nr:inverse autotransporter beta domain-containing protein [Xenorhabdus kozodoii]PHM74909.1 putative invasin [Xenorhabdus kozodoii]
MDSYINHKVFRFSILMCSLFLPFATTSAISAGEETQQSRAENKRFLQGSSNVNRADDARDRQAATDAEAGVIAQNIQRVGGILSSSPSQLTEQAKSYALGKLNGTVTSEAQKWLSQFGTANINLALDSKGKLETSALDLLLPLYDNKADWLLFTQLGYRHHDSRDILNVGLGGRYFTPSWMYGLNTFFDNDFTGKHKRVGVGGEVWTDYARFSANSYWRASKWRESEKELDYEERPANGFDIIGEFFLPAYPNLGGKLSYEQYFGDSVGLFNRETKEKDPSQARFGVNYTPVSLVTLGADYKIASGGHSEGLFLANLNYRFGVPFADQISSDSVAAMRTLAGSRYDLVQRNNNIVLEYKKKPEFNLSLPSILSGYSAQHVQVTPQMTAENRLKKLSWQANDEFRKNGGAIIPGNKSIEIDLPKYVAKGVNSYTLSATADLEGNSKPKTTQMNLVVEPFAIKEQSIKPNGSGPVISDGKSAYDLAAIITYGDKNNPPIKNTVIPDVKWSIEPEDKDATLTWDKSGKTDDKGQLTATLSTTKPLAANTKVYLSLDDQPQLELTGQIAPTDQQIKLGDIILLESPKIATANGTDHYTFKVQIFDADDTLLKNKTIGKLKTELKVNTDKGSPIDAPQGVKLEEPTNLTTDEEGNLVLNMTSTVGINDVYFIIYPDSTDTTSGSKQSNKVIFEPILEPIGIILSTSHNATKTPNPYKPFPANYSLHNVTTDASVFLALSGAGNDPQGTGDFILTDVEVSDPNAVKMDPTTKAIYFPLKAFKTGRWPVTVTATATDQKTQIVKRVTHTFNPARLWFTDISLNSHQVSHESTCSDERTYSYYLPGDTQVQTDKTTDGNKPTLMEVGGVNIALPSSLNEEYDKTILPGFGFGELERVIYGDIIPKLGSSTPLTVRVQETGGLSKDAVRYNYVTRTWENNPTKDKEDIYLCVIRRS